MKLQIPIKYRLYGGYLWTTVGDDQKWTKSRVVKGKSFTPINQKFGENLNDYSQFGLKGHNGLDWFSQDGTCLYMPFNGEIISVKQETTGYGWSIGMVSEVFHEGGKQKRYYAVYGHQKKQFVEVGDFKKVGDLIALADSTGFSTGPHLHDGIRILEPITPSLQLQIPGWGYKNNEYAGFVDQISFYESVEVKEIDFLKDIELIQRTEVVKGAAGQIYKIIDGLPKFLDSDKDAASRHIPLVDWVLEKNKTGLPKGFIRSITEAQWDLIKDLEI